MPVAAALASGCKVLGPEDGIRRDLLRQLPDGLASHIAMARPDDLMAEAFRKSGFAVSTGDSTWRLDGEHPELIAALAGGACEAVLETGQVIPATVDDWREARKAAERAAIGDHDLWARPV